ncbi:hypothetical protein [Algoriphagus confluentis]|uniref:Lipoprotein n=1 Tax=Algoriphagus confluentis TaxID=1697556 RepID=A0ABQ6PTD5_9BACT|nr:hypothetical protein Aconfl_38570 [Algoriphagus confluentis]
MKIYSKFIHNLILIVLTGFLINGCIEAPNSFEQNLNTLEKEDLADKAKNYYENWENESKRNLRHSTEFTTIYPDWSLLSHINNSRFVTVPAKRKLNTLFGEKAYLRRIVFEFTDDGEIKNAGIIELIGLDLEYLMENENSLIKEYFEGKQNNEKVIYIWSDLNYENQNNSQINGYEVYIIQKEGIRENNQRILSCTDWYYVYTLNGIVIGEEYLYTTCSGDSCNENSTDACLEEPPQGGGGNSGMEVAKICGTYSFTNVGNSLTAEIRNLGMTAVNLSLFQGRGQVIPVELGPMCFNFSASSASSISASTIINEAFNSTTIEIQQGLNNGTINATNIYIEFKNKFGQNFNTLKNSFGLTGSQAGFSYGQCFGSVTTNEANYLCP